MPTVKASINGTLLAETSTWEEVEGNIYFPPSTIQESFFVKSDHTTYCGWKGDAKYFSVVIGDVTIPNAAWYYPAPFDKAKHIKDFVAFYPNKIDVKVE